MGEYSSVERKGHIWVVTIERPDRLNALHPPANAELGRVFDDFASDDEAWVAIITGRGERAFSAGNDLVYQAEGGEVVPTPYGFGGLTARFDLSKPVIAAVNGYAMGGGFEIALACDLIIAAEHAVFALPEPHVGLAALAGGLHRLPRQIGLKQAMGMILTGRRVSAAEGQSLGFVNEVVPGDALMSQAMKWAEDICSCSPASIQTSKDVIQRGLAFGSLEEAMQQPYESVKRLRQSPDFVEGPKAFSEKRKPNWQGYDAK
jgi:enoyl-CoA hydratase/carnithine racemase